MAISPADAGPDASLELTNEQARDFFEKQVRLYLNMSADEFLHRRETGELDAEDPRTNHLILLLPFAR
jgi:hypothetical protein